MRLASSSFLRGALVAAAMSIALPLLASSTADDTSPIDSPATASDRLDADPAARYVPLPITLPPGSALTHRLRSAERGLRHRPDHPVLLRERAFIRYARGEIDAAEADYARALQVAGADALMRRHVLWSQGWSRFTAGNDEAALAAWREAATLHGGRPFWWPYTAALAEWRLGRRDEAVALYDRAVRGMPEWGTEGGFTARTRHWSEHQFDVASAVFTAWQKTSSPRHASAP